ncbi:MAG: hypothetical protein ACOYNK_00685 [Microbacteriaceae bacterium]
MTTLIYAAMDIDPNGVTPGVFGFLATAGVGLAVGLLALDLVRRIRRLRYREEARLSVDAEQAVDKLIDSIDKETGNR